MTRTSRENWSMHDRGFWERHAGNPRLTLWHRVYALAYAKHRRNGHAPFERGELALAVAVVNEDTGELAEPSAQRLSEAIGTAVEYGFLDGQSTSSCLVVPDGIFGGTVGDTRERCTRRHGARSNFSASGGKNYRNFPVQAETLSGSSGNDNALTCGNVVGL